MTPEADFDVAVVGAGPAGASLALRLARAGRTCLLLDGAGTPREKLCGEGLLPAGVAALDALGLGHVARSDGVAFDGIRYRLPGGVVAEGVFPGGALALGVRRLLLDARLLAAARAEPNVAWRQAWVQALGLPPADAPGARGGVTLRTSDGAEVRARVVVGADGCRSTVRRLAGLEARRPPPPRFGVGAHLALAPGPRPKVEVFLGRGFELYLTPVDPAVTGVAALVGEARLGSLQGRLDEALRELLREAAAGVGEGIGGGGGASGNGGGAPGPYAALAGAPAVGERARALGPLGLQARRAHAPGLVLVGDAAGALDPITGEGMALALVTGAIAAEVLLACLARGDLGASALREWTRRRRRAVRGIALLTRAVLHLAQRPERAARAVDALARSPETFARLLGVAAGLTTWRALTLRDGLRLAVAVRGL